MNEQLIAALQTELAYLQQTGNPRARQVKARLAEETGEPSVMEDAVPAAPQEKAVPARRGRSKTEES